KTLSTDEKDSGRKGDWKKVAQRAQEALVKESKDLRIACGLLEALVRSSGFPGLRDGLKLLERLVADCWDRLQPSIDDGDLGNRGAPLENMLNDPDGGMLFPETVRRIPFFGSSQLFGLSDWKRVRVGEEKNAETAAAVQRAVQESTREQVLAAAEEM